MITIGNQQIDITTISSGYAPGSVEYKILSLLDSSPKTHSYSSIGQLQFELQLRSEIVNAANELYRSRLAFRIFRDTMCNPAYWERTNNGGFLLKQGVRPSEAIQDIFINSSLYGTECATAMVIIYYKALLNVFPPEQFDRMFPSIYLMNWHQIDPLLREVGWMRPISVYLPGDRRYFMNPDVDPMTPQWQGENVIDMGDGTYYGHGVGRFPPEIIISALNENRREDADESAYLLDTVGNPNYKNLYRYYERGLTAAS